MGGSDSGYISFLVGTLLGNRMYAESSIKVGMLLFALAVACYILSNIFV